MAQGAVFSVTLAVAAGSVLGPTLSMDSGRGSPMRAGQAAGLGWGVRPVGWLWIQEDNGGTGACGRRKWGVILSVQAFQVRVRARRADGGGSEGWAGWSGALEKGECAWRPGAGAGGLGQ